MIQLRDLNLLSNTCLSFLIVQVGTSESIEDQINRVFVSEVGAGEDLSCSWIANNLEVIRTLSTLFQVLFTPFFSFFFFLILLYLS